LNGFLIKHWYLFLQIIWQIKITYLNL
jgi:hypothetical protein